jgi:hypothetical protein
MIQSNASHPASTERSPFQSAQSALARKPLPGPMWAWAGLAAVAVSGLAYLVTRGPAEHAPRAAAQVSSAEPDAPNPEVATAAASGPSPSPAEAPAAAAPENAAPNGGAAPPAAEPEPAKASDGAADVVASNTPVTKKKARTTRRSSRKRSAATQ